VADRALVFHLIGRDQSLSRSFDRAEQKATKFQRSMRRVGTAVGAALASQAVVTGVKTSITAASDLNETLNKVNLAFGKNAGAIRSWAQGSAKNMGLPKQAALENAATFGLLFSKLGIAGGEASKMSQAMVQLAVDLGSVHNADPTQVLEAQAAAFRGEYDALQRFVPALSDAAVKQEALRQTGKTSTAQLTQQERTLAVYSLMMRQTTREQGDFARTANESANKGKILAARVKDLQANVGTLLLPAITALANKLGDMADWAEKNRGAVQALGATILAVTGFVVAMNVATKVAVAVQAAIRGATIAWAAAQKILNFVLAANPIGLVITAIALLVAGLVLAYKRSETFRKIVDGAFRAVAASGKAMWERVLKPTFSFLIRSWLNVADWIIRGAARAFGWMPGLGPKIRAAADKFRVFKDKVNEHLRRLNSKEITVTATFGFKTPAGVSMHDIVGATGGYVTPTAIVPRRLHRGGFLDGPGTETSDSIPARLSKGEYVVRAKAVRAVGRGTMDWINAQGFAGGGGVDLDTKIANPALMGTALGRFEGVIERGMKRLAAKWDKFAEAGGALGGGSGPGGWRWQMAVLRSVFPGLPLISGFRPGAITATGNRSYHSMGRAVDIPPRMDVANWIRATYGRNTKELIFSPMGGRQVWNGRPHTYTGITRANHWDHVHWAYDKGGWLMPGTTIAQNNTGKPERVLAPDERIPTAAEIAKALARELRRNPPVVKFEDVRTAGLAYKSDRGGRPIGLG
jgi:hypothetical protein